MALHTSILLLAALLAALPAGCRAQSVRRSRSHECAAFTPTLCAIPASVAREHCDACSFDPSRVFICPLVAAGYYSYATGQSEGGGCPNPFMAQTHHMPPPCGARCCRTNHEGAFAEDDPLEEEASPTAAVEPSAVIGAATAPLPRLIFEPTDSTCRYKEISRGQVMRFMAMHNSSILVVGDSTMRQMYLRLVGMMRGQQRTLDWHLHTHAQYRVCRETDFLRLAANNPSGAASPSDALFLKGQVPAFFKNSVGPGQADAKRVLSECSHPPLEFNYLQAPLWSAQADMLDRYFGGLAPGHRPVVIMSVGFWQSGPRVPVSYLRLLHSLRDTALRVVYVGVPVSRVLDPERRDALAARNERMRRWAARQGPPFSFVDFDAMVKAPGAPNSTVGSKHFACWVEWEAARFPAGAAGNPAGSAQVEGKVRRLHVDRSTGSCADELNRSLLQVILNGLLDTSGAQALQAAEDGDEAASGGAEPGGGAGGQRRRERRRRRRLASWFPGL